MDPLVVAVLKAAGTVGGFALFVYVLYRLVLAAKKAGRTGSAGQIVGLGLMIFGAVLAPAPPPPPREVATESREQKRNQDTGDPP